MITGDIPLTTFHIAELAEFADRDALILDLKEKLNITDPSQSIDESLLAKYNILMMRAASRWHSRRFEERSRNARGLGT